MVIYGIVELSPHVKTCQNSIIKDSSPIALPSAALAEAASSQQLPSQVSFQAQNRYVSRRIFNVQLFLGIQN
jgi:hypothetical protein